MKATGLIDRMSLSPDPDRIWARNMRRIELSSIAPVDDPNVVLYRPYGIARNMGASTMPIDYTMSHWGGTLRGRKLGQWRSSLMVAPDPQPVNAPTMFSWRPSAIAQKAGEQWIPEAWDDSEEL